MQNGVIYILTQNERYVNLALQSIASVKRVMPDLPVTVFSQFPISSPLIERVISVQPAQDGALAERHRSHGRGRFARDAECAERLRGRKDCAGAADEQKFFVADPSDLDDPFRGERRGVFGGGAAVQIERDCRRVEPSIRILRVEQGADFAGGNHALHFHTTGRGRPEPFDREAKTVKCRL